MDTVATVTLYLPEPLRTYGGGVAELPVSAGTVQGVLDDLERTKPVLYRNVCDETGAVRDEMLRTMLRRHGIADRLLHLPHWAARSLAAANESAWRLARISCEPMLTRYAVAHLAESFTLDVTRARAQLDYAPRWNFRDAPLGPAGVD